MAFNGFNFNGGGVRFHGGDVVLASSIYIFYRAIKGVYWGTIGFFLLFWGRFLGFIVWVSSDR